MVTKLAEKLNIDVASVWKFAATLVGWLLMGTWMAAKIAAGNEALREDMRNIRNDVHSISIRLDTHVDQTRKDQ